MQRGALTQFRFLHKWSGKATAVFMFQEKKLKPRLRKFKPVT